MFGATMDASEYLRRQIDEMRRLDCDQIQALSDSIYQRYLAGRFVFVIGNGGSAANASHLCEDLGKGAVADFDTQKRLKIMSLTDNTPYILAWANDTSFERIFVEQLKNFAEAGDLLIAISGSGNSRNILSAVEWANANNLETFGVTGFDGGSLRRVASQVLHCPLNDMGMVESLHSIAFHYVVDDIHGRVNGLKGQRRAA